MSLTHPVNCYFLSMRATSLLGTLALLLALGAPHPAAADGPEPALIDRVEVVIGDRIVTSSDVRLEAELARRLPSPVEALRRQETRDPRAAVIERTIIRGLAAQASIYQPTAAEVVARLLALKRTFPDTDAYEAFLDRHGLTEEALSSRLYGRLVVERYVHRNIDLASQAAREGVADYYRRYEEWIDTQRASADIRYVELRP